MNTTYRILVAVVGAGVCAALGLFLADPSNSNAAYSQLSAPGKAVPIFYAPASAAIAGHDSHPHRHATQAKVIAQHGLLTFYVQQVPGGPPCYGTGSLNVSGQLVPGSLTCVLPESKFPSPEEPLLVRLGLEANKPDGVPMIRTFTGFAADGVASLAVYATNGAQITKQDVTANSFSLPLGSVRREQVGSLAAFDASGAETYRLNMAIPTGS